MGRSTSGRQIRRRKTRLMEEKDDSSTHTHTTHGIHKDSSSSSAASSSIIAVCGQKSRLPIRRAVHAMKIFGVVAPPTLSTGLLSILGSIGDIYRE